MNERSLAKDQPSSFVFSDKNQLLAKNIISKYPKNYQSSAVIPLLDLVQEQTGWVSRAAIEQVANLLKMPFIRVLEVATFYTMFNLSPVGEKHIQICTNLPCLLSGSDDVLKCIKDKLGIDIGETTGDGFFSLSEVECAGACVNAPIVAIGKDYYEDLSYDLMCSLIDKIKNNETINPGSMTDRSGSSPDGKRTTLIMDPKVSYQKQNLSEAKLRYDQSKK